MAGSKCPKCEWTNFECVIETPASSNYKLTFVRCSKCKTVVGVLDYTNIGSALSKIGDKLGVKI